MIPHAKAAKASLDGSAVALRLRGGVLLRAVLERGLCLPRHGTHGLNEASGVANVVGPTIPDSCDMLPALLLIKPALLSYR